MFEKFLPDLNGSTMRLSSCRNGIICIAVIEEEEVILSASVEAVVKVESSVSPINPQYLRLNTLTSRYEIHSKGH